MQEEESKQELSNKAFQEFLRQYGSEALISLKEHRKNTSKDILSESKLDSESKSLPSIINKKKEAAEEKNPTQQESVNLVTPNDGRCMFFAIANSILIPLLDDDDKFEEEFQNLFPKNKKHIHPLKNLLIEVTQGYNKDPKSPLAGSMLINNEMYGSLIQGFRARVVQTMETNIIGDNTKGILADPEYYSGFNIDGFEVINENYLIEMMKPATYAGNHELCAISDLLNKNIKLPTTTINKEGQNNPIVEIHYNGIDHYEAIADKNVLTRVSASTIAPIKPSETVVSGTRFNRKKHQERVEYRLKSSSERAPSPFEKTDGDHRTAIGFIREGFLSLLQDLVLDSKDGIDSLKNEKRHQLYNYISVVAAMDTEDRRLELYSGINKALDDYNIVRLKKEQISALKVKDNPVNKEIIKKLREINAVQTLESLSEIYRVFMTFCNQMPNSFVKIEEREASTDEGNRVDKANSFFTNGLTDKDIDESQEEVNKAIDNLSKARSRKQVPEKILKGKREEHHELLIKTTVERLSDTFFYLEIPEQHLKKHRDETLGNIDEGISSKLKNKFNTNKTKELYARNNSPESLVSAITHHLNIAFVRYSELTQKFTPRNIIDKFVDRVITEKHKIRNNDKPSQELGKLNQEDTNKFVPGWPEIAKDPDLILDIKEKVEQQLQKLCISIFIDEEELDDQSQAPASDQLQTLYQTINDKQLDNPLKPGKFHYTVNPGYEKVKSSRGSAATAEGRTSEDSKKSAKDLQGELDKAWLNEYKVEDLLESLKDKFESNNISQEDKNSITQLSNSWEGNKAFEKEKVIEVLNKLKVQQEGLSKTSPEEFLESLNEIFEDILEISHPIDLKLKSGNYINAITSSINHISENANDIVTKNQLVNVLKDKFKEFSLENSESESFVKKLGLVKKADSQSFIRGVQFRSKDGYNEV